MLEDLNNYCECMIPIDESNSINIKLFPTYAPPPPVKAWHVPVSTVELTAHMDVNWDLTIQRIVPHIDGINSVRRISELADADFKLTKKAISHLLYYGCLIMVDVFQFSAIYACTAEISSLITDLAMQEECANYIADAEAQKVKPAEVAQLYCSLSQGVTLKKWCMENAAKLKGVDIRRFIAFGVVKGFVYRVHKWPVAVGGGPRGGMERWVQGGCCLDEICTELQRSEKEVVAMLETADVQILHR